MVLLIDYKRPISESQREEILQVLTSMPTYSAVNDGCFAVEDLPKFLKEIGITTTDYEISKLSDFWSSNFNGTCPKKHLMEVITAWYDTILLFTKLAKLCDRDGNGLISEDEFSELLKVIVAHDPNFCGRLKSYDSFIEQADTNKDGKVTVEECVQWIEKFWEDDIEQNDKRLYAHI